MRRRDFFSKTACAIGAAMAAPLAFAKTKPKIATFETPIMGFDPTVGEEKWVLTLWFVNGRGEWESKAIDEGVVPNPKWVTWSPRQPASKEVKV